MKNYLQILEIYLYHIFLIASLDLLIIKVLFRYDKSMNKI